MWPLLSLTAVLEPEVRVECWVRTSVPAHPEGCCCQDYKVTTSHQTSRTPQCVVILPHCVVMVLFQAVGPVKIVVFIVFVLFSLTSFGALFDNKYV